MSPNVKKKSFNFDLNNNEPLEKINFQNSHQLTVPFPLAPPYLKFNPWITHGYRNITTLKGCVVSTLQWTNETVNIWTHFTGWLIFLALTIFELQNAETMEKMVLMTLVLVCFQLCMLLSSCYHTFCCTSPSNYHRWLTFDLFGVSMSLLGIYLSGIYFAFKCDTFWLNFYLLTITIILIAALISNFGDHSCDEGFHWRLVLFGAWAAYGIIPTVQFVIVHGFEDEIVKHLLPSILTMYLLSSAAFFFYLSRFPERLFPGKFNYAFSSHNIWHILIFVALFYWYTVCKEYFQRDNVCK